MIWGAGKGNPKAYRAVSFCDNNNNQKKESLASFQRYVQKPIISKCVLRKKKDFLKNKSLQASML